MSGSFVFDNSTVDDYSPMVVQIASEYRKKYPMVERDDIIQELWIWFSTHIRKMTEWMDLDQKDRDKLVAKSLRNAAYDYCFKQKAQIEGYDPQDVFFYRKDFIKTILPAIITDDWTRIERGLQNTGMSTRALSESNDWLAYIADVKSALDSLDEKDRLLVVEFYGKDIDGATLHEHILPEKGSARAAMMQANRALNKMVRFLGGYPPYKDPKDTDETT
jgi:hypothetical protein